MRNGSPASLPILFHQEVFLQVFHLPPFRDVPFSRFRPICCSLSTPRLWFFLVVQPLLPRQWRFESSSPPFPPFVEVILKHNPPNPLTVYLGVYPTPF